MIRKTVVVMGAALTGVFVWHLICLPRDLGDDGSDARVNPLTNLVIIELDIPDANGDPWADLGNNLAMAFAGTVGPGLIERELNTRARESLDVYAIVLPYRVRLRGTEGAEPAQTTGQPGQETARATEERGPREAEAAYLEEFVDLESYEITQQVVMGERWWIIEGTLVNRGERTVSRLNLRVYFLDAAGQRIGEEDYLPVTEYSWQDASPLRPGYRRDFDYRIDDDAPSGWSDDVELQLQGLEFSDSQRDQ